MADTNNAAACLSMATLHLLLLLFLRLAPAMAADSDADLLLSFKNSLPDPSVLSSWNANQSPCSYQGLLCKGGRVSSLTLQATALSPDFRSLSTLLSLPNLETLSLRSVNLTGDIAAVTKCAGQLTALDLSGNTLRGSVSDAVSLATSCSSLQLLNLSSNSIGLLPLKKGSAASPPSFPLKTLDLSYNKIAGAADFQWLLSGLGILQRLDLSANKIPGSLPEISNCTSLQYLDLSTNFLSGDVPPGTFSSCAGLTYLNLSSNHFTGAAPPDLASLTRLTTLSLAYNNFTGEAPFAALTSMAELKLLELGFNNFSGQLPESISKLTALEILDLSSNRFSGAIPNICSSGGSTSLKELYFQNNYFSGTIPASLSNCTELVSLDLSLNELTGSIPGSLGTLSELKDIIMWQNGLNGEIPAELSSLKSLENLILDYNGLTGEIPDGLANCTALNWISLASNKLSGSIPAWIGKLESLAILKLGNNSLTGPIPPELGDCKSLIWLDLNGNQLNGSIPAALAKQSGKMPVGLITGKRYVYLRNDENSQCHGTGSLLEFGGIRSDDLTRMPSKRLCNFTRVYMGNTQYTFNNNGSMIFLDLSYNQLEGSIPKEIGTMFYLMILNLGHNLLSGLIPREIGFTHVAVLDLSHNKLEGPIPATFSAMSLSQIDLSNNELNGSIPTLGSLATFPKYVYENNSGLCGFPLPPCDNNSEPTGGGSHQRSHREASLAGSVALGLLFSLFCIFGLVIIAIESRKRQKKKEEMNASRDFYLDSRTQSGTISNWKLSGTNAFSINLATFEKPLQKLTFGDLYEATNGFHNDSHIGAGGFGDVYKAQLKDGKIVAIKKLIHISGQGDREFTAEMETIGKIKHRNLVPLLGYCRVGEERLLVYDYMKYGSLEDVLHDRKKTGMKLSWLARRKIAVGAARGLAFLHHNCIPHIIHRDMKSSNVLLDEHLEARVSDFGMARMMSAMDTHLSVSTLAGTPGYVPPEYYQSFRCTTKGDVYSYGVVLLELLTGRQPTDCADFGEDNNLVGWVKQHSKTKITDVFDEEMMKEDPSLELELLEHLKIACACLDDRPSRRPTMLKVMTMFKEIQAGSTVDSKGSSGPPGASMDSGFMSEMSSLKEENC